MKNLLDTSQLEKFTVEEFQSDFDNLMNRVENGESFLITSEYGNAVMVPYDKTSEHFMKVYTETIETMKINNQEDYKKLFDIVESGEELQEEKEKELKDVDQELIDMYNDVDSF